MTTRREIDRMKSEMEELFADLCQVPRLVARRAGFDPALDVYRTDDPPAITVVVELAGIDPDGVDAAGRGRRPHVRGRRSRPAGDRRFYQHIEIDYGIFERRVQLNEAVDSEAASATYEYGLLHPPSARPRGPGGSQGDHPGDGGIMSAVEETVRPGEEAVAEVLPILPLKETVVFPDSMTPLAVGQERSIQLVDEAVANDSTIALVTTRNAEEEAEGAEDIYDVGTAALIHKMIRVPDGTLRILVQGVRRVRLDRLVQTDPYLAGEFSDLPDVEGPETEVEALARNVEALFSRVIGLVPYLPDELQLAAGNAEDASTLANLIATTMRLKTAEKQELLEEADIEARLRKLTVILNRELEVSSWARRSSPRCNRRWSTRSASTSSASS
jgi:Lon protease-like protein/HSP20 family molecular chaperone IbpA